MNKYENGKIYKITSKQTDDVYIGSTIHPLKIRMSGHKSAYKIGKKTASVSKIIKYDDAIIELIENYPCETKQDLFWRERYYLENTKCVNYQRRAIRSDEDIQNFKKIHLDGYWKNYYANNKEKLKAKRKIKKQIYEVFKRSHFGQLCQMF